MCFCGVRKENKLNTSDLLSTLILAPRKKSSYCTKAGPVKVLYY